MSPIASRLRGKIKEKMDQKWCRAEQRCGFDTEDKTGQKRKHREEYQRNQACKGDRADGAGPYAGSAGNCHYEGVPREDRTRLAARTCAAAERDKERAGDKL